MKPAVLLWLNEIAPCRDAMKRAGLAERVEVHAGRLGEVPRPEALVERVSAQFRSG